MAEYSPCMPTVLKVATVFYPKKAVTMPLLLGPSFLQFPPPSDFCTILHDDTQDDLLHNLPWHRGQTFLDPLSSPSCRQLSHLLTSCQLGPMVSTSASSLSTLVWVPSSPIDLCMSK